MTNLISRREQSFYFGRSRRLVAVISTFEECSDQFVSLTVWNHGVGLVALEVSLIIIFIILSCLRRGSNHKPLLLLKRSAWSSRLFISIDKIRLPVYKKCQNYHVVQSERACIPCGFNSLKMPFSSTVQYLVVLCIFLGVRYQVPLILHDSYQNHVYQVSRYAPRRPPWMSASQAPLLQSGKLSVPINIPAVISEWHIILGCNLSSDMCLLQGPFSHRPQWDALFTEVGEYCWLYDCRKVCGCLPSSRICPCRPGRWARMLYVISS